jgi:ribosomal protein S12 methylthiotransferase accessory factor
LTATAGAAQDTWRRLQDVLDTFGVTRVCDLTGLDIIGVPVSAAVRPSATTLAVSSGKGLDQVSARVGAAMESIELACAERFSPEIAARASARDLGVPYDVVDLARHPLAVLDNSTTLNWCLAENLLDGGRVAVPCDSFGLRGGARRQFMLPGLLGTTNGIGAGGSRAEALRHGLLELCERHALGRHEFQSSCELDFGGPNGRVLDLLLERLARAGCRVRGVEVIGVPSTFTMAIYIASPDMPHVFSGSGCATNRYSATVKALLEAIQSRAVTISGARDDLPAWTFGGGSHLGDPLLPVGTINPVANTVGNGLADVPDSSLPASEEVSLLVEAISSVTRRPVAAVELSSSEAWPVVVQVVAPGLSPSLRAEPGSPIPRIEA